MKLRDKVTLRQFVEHLLDTDPMPAWVWWLLLWSAVILH